MQTSSSTLEKYGYMYGFVHTMDFYTDLFYIKHNNAIIFKYSSALLLCNVIFFGIGFIILMLNK